MKNILLAFLAIFVFVGVASADVYVRGYYRQDGTYVQPHYRTSPNDTITDNYSYKDNTNPYHTQKPYYEKPKNNFYDPHPRGQYENNQFYRY